jgi:glycine betaine/proline transport system substrate-binding protein
MKVQEIVGMALADAAKAEAEAAMMMEDRPTIVFADLNWDSAQIQNGIARYIVEKGYGYETDALFGGTVPLFQGLLVGDIDVTMEIWLPNQNNVWEPALAAGRVVDVGKSLSDNWQSAFVIPTYLADANPSLKTVQDLKDHLGLFEQEGGKAVLWTCIANWSCAAVNADQVVSYGLSDSLTLKDPGSQAGLFASLQGAYDKEEPWLGYMWGPSLPAAELDLTLLEEPACAPGQAPNAGCEYPIAQIKIAVHPSMYDKAPDVITFLSNWDFTAEADVAANAYKAETGVGFDELAVWFLKNQEATWTQWVPGDVAEKVKAALAQEA